MADRMGKLGKSHRLDPISHLHFQNMAGPQGHAGSLERNVGSIGLNSILH